MNCDCGMNRRDALKTGAVGFGYLAFAAMLAEQARAEAPLQSAVENIASHPLAPKAPHFTARAKRVIFLFMKGGPSQVDTFDHKPLLDRDDGKPLPFAKPRVQFAADRQPAEVALEVQASTARAASRSASCFRTWPSCVDDLCIINSLHGTNPAHGGALLKLHTGSDNFVRPSMGSWITYGLGTENQNLPGFITICPTLAHGGVNNWSSAFLPAVYQGTPIGNASIPADQAMVNRSSRNATRLAGACSGCSSICWPR